MKIPIGCNEASRLLSEDLEQSLSQQQRSILKAHLAVCETCRYFGQHLKWLRTYFTNMAKRELEADDPGHRLSAEAKRKIKARLAQKDD